MFSIFWETSREGIVEREFLNLSKDRPQTWRVDFISSLSLLSIYTVNRQNKHIPHCPKTNSFSAIQTIQDQRSGFAEYAFAFSTEFLVM